MLGASAAVRCSNPGARLHVAQRNEYVAAAVTSRPPRAVASPSSNAPKKEYCSAPCSAPTAGALPCGQKRHSHLPRAGITEHAYHRCSRIVGSCCQWLLGRSGRVICYALPVHHARSTSMVALMKPGSSDIAPPPPPAGKRFPVCNFRVPLASYVPTFSSFRWLIGSTCISKRIIVPLIISVLQSSHGTVRASVARRCEQGKRCCDATVAMPAQGGALCS